MLRNEECRQYGEATRWQAARRSVQRPDRAGGITKRSCAQINDSRYVLEKYKRATPRRVDDPTYGGEYGTTHSGLISQRRFVNQR